MLLIHIMGICCGPFDFFCLGGQYYDLGHPNEDLTKIVDFLLLVYFWFSVIFHESVSSYQALAKASSRNCLFWSPFFSCYCHPIVLSFISLVLGRPSAGRDLRLRYYQVVECSKKFGGLLLPVSMLTNGSSGLSHVTGRRSS